MVQIRTSPSEHSFLMLEARKSCSFSISLVDGNGAPISLAGGSITLAISPVVRAATELPLLTVTAEPTGAEGVSQFNLQASVLDLTPGEFDFAITVVLEGYSFVVMKGTLEVVQNTDFSAGAASYNTPLSNLNVQAVIRANGTVRVVLGHALPPGIVRAPAGGNPGQVLAKKSTTHYDVEWATVEGATSSLPPGGTTGQVLAKTSNANHAVGWTTVNSAPAYPGVTWVRWTSGPPPARPTADASVLVLWLGVGAPPPVVASGTTGRHAHDVFMQLVVN